MLDYGIYTLAIESGYILKSFNFMAESLEGTCTKEFDAMRTKITAGMRCSSRSETVAIL